jgi:glycosyltransferase involved in cell wall biosynthesis
MAMDLPERPLVTVITPVMNGARHVQECLDSVLAQTYANVEHILVDGGSTDGTLDILRAYDDRVAYWRSEPDSGIYDAMNRGLDLARGSIVGIAGSDDALTPSGVASVVRALSVSPHSAYTYGAVDLVRDSGETFGRTDPLGQAFFKTRPYHDMPFNHLSLFVRSEVYRRIGGFNTRYRVRADWDFLLRMLAHGYRGVRVAGSVGRYRVGGTSDRLSTCLETRRLLREHRAPRLRTEWMFLSSIVKLWIVSSLPFPVVRRLTRLRRSRHVLH